MPSHFLGYQAERLLVWVQKCNVILNVGWRYKQVWHMATTLKIAPGLAIPQAVHSHNDSMTCNFSNCMSLNHCVATHMPVIIMSRGAGRGGVCMYNFLLMQSHYSGKYSRTLQNSQGCVKLSHSAFFIELTGIHLQISLLESLQVKHRFLVKAV